MPAKTVIQLRRDTAANWTSSNPVLAAGEAGVESDTNKFKIGDGTSTWSQLSYFLNEDDLPSPVASINTQATSYTIQASDANNIIEVNSTSNTTVTIPADSTLNLPIGTSIDIVNVNSGDISIANQSIVGPNYGIWTTSTISTSVFRVSDVAHNGSNLWLAAGYSPNMVIASTDGTSWTTRSTPSLTQSGGAEAIAYGNGRWIVGTELGEMATSTDGTAWSGISSPFPLNHSVKTITFGNSLWLASGYNNSGAALVFSSTNGTAWSTVTSNFNGSTVEKISFGNNLWVMVGQGGRIRTSANGSSWTTVTSNFGSSDIRAVAFGNGLWVAGGAAGQMRISTDATTWTTVTSNFGTSIIESIAYGNGLWVAVGRSGRIRTSTDATTWTTVTSNFGTTNILGVAVSNGIWVAVGEGNGQIRKADYSLQFLPNILSKDSNTKITSQYAGATLYKRAANEWVAIGDLSA